MSKSNRSTNPDDECYKDEDTLKKYYHGEGMSLAEIGSVFNVNRNTIRYWMDKHGIDRRDRIEACKSNCASFGTLPRGYEYWRVSDSLVDELVYVHRIVAIANGADPYDVFSGQYHIHHDNEIKWDNRPENLEVIRQSDHFSEHHTRGSFNVEKIDYEIADEIRERYKGDETQYDLADEYGLTQSHIGNIVRNEVWVND